MAGDVRDQTSADDGVIAVPDWEDGDVLVAFVACRGDGTITDPAGWTLIEAHTTGGTATDVRIRVLRRFAAGEPASYTWTVPALNAMSIMVSCSGVGATTPVRDDSTSESGTGTNLIAASVSALSSGLLLCGFFGRYSTPGVTHTIASMTEVADQASGIAGTVAGMVAKESPSTGGTGSRTATSSLAPIERISVAIALNPGGAKVAETDEARAGVTVIAKAGDQSNEIDEARAGLRAIALAGVTASETDLAQAGTSTVDASGAQVGETDEALTGTPIVATAGAQAEEADTAGPGSLGNTAVAGIEAGETDEALSGAPVIGGLAGVAMETDVAQVGEVHVVVAGIQAVETDTGGVGAPRLVKAGVRSTENDTARIGSPIIAPRGSRAIVNDQGIGGLVAVAISGTGAIETDTATGGTPVVTVTGVHTVEIDEAGAGSPAVIMAGAQAFETDTAVPGSLAVVVVGTQAEEINEALFGAVLAVGVWVRCDTRLVGVRSCGTVAAQARSCSVTEANTARDCGT